VITADCTMYAERPLRTKSFTEDDCAMEWICAIIDRSRMISYASLFRGAAIVLTKRILALLYDAS
jgi:hypothetical protein